MCKTTYSMETRFGRFAKTRLNEGAASRQPMIFTKYRHTLGTVASDFAPILRSVWDDVEKTGVDVLDYEKSMQAVSRTNEMREVTMRADGMLYYLSFKPAPGSDGKLPPKDEILPMHPGHATEVKTTVGRFLRRVVEAHGGLVRADALADATAVVQAAYRLHEDRASKLSFKLVSGEVIKDAYFADGVPLNLQEAMKFYDLSLSCMRQDYLRPAFDFYANNSNISMLVALDEHGVLEARTLVWKATDGHQYYDRTYATSPVIAHATRMHAEKLGLEAIPNERIQVQLENSSFKYYPYADTMKYLNAGEGLLSNEVYEMESSYDEIYELRSTSGGYYEYCQDCSATGVQPCDVCSGNTTTECSTCEGSGTEECSRCDGMGQEDCGKCDGTGVEGTVNITCEECDGDGEINGEACVECEGHGRVDKDVVCIDCNGAKEYVCSHCDGDSTQECGDCEGSGEIECSNCGGGGTESCVSCHGESQIEHAGLDT